MSCASAARRMRASSKRRVRRSKQLRLLSLSTFGGFKTPPFRASLKYVQVEPSVQVCCVIFLGLPFKNLGHNALKAQTPHIYQSRLSEKVGPSDMLLYIFCLKTGRPGKLMGQMFAPAREALLSLLEKLRPLEARGT